jgi:quinol monooxygenase YgiN
LRKGCAGGAVDQLECGRTVAAIMLALTPPAFMIATFGERKMTLPPGGPGRGMLLASIGFRVQPHKRSEALSAVEETVRRMRITSGCARSRLLEDSDDPNAFMLLSEWHSTATADLFFNSRDFQIFKGIRILLREEPVIVFDEVQSRMVRLLRSP